MIKRLLYLLPVMIFCSCQHSGMSGEVERAGLKPTGIVSDSIETMMPGGIYVTDHFILWTNPFHADYFVHILDKKSGKEVGKMVRIGEGPDEFISPAITPLSDDRLFIYNPYTGKVGIQSITAAVKGENPVIFTQTQNLGDGSTIVFTEQEERILFNPSVNPPFTLDKGGRMTTFGTLPVKEDINTGVHHFQGKLAYNPSNQVLVYTALIFPYYAVYKREGDNFMLSRELLNTTDYTLKNREFTYHGSVRGPQGLALTTDYIVTIERDPSVDQTDGMKIGRDFSQLPRQIFLYDYNLQLRKILDLDRPLAWIAADPKTNTLYVVSTDEDFIILKYEL